MQPIIDLADVAVTRAGRNILGPLNWSVNPGEHWVVMGPNGAGKTTMVSVCAGLIHPTRGRATILDAQLGRTDVRELRTRVGLCSAALAALLPPEETVFDSILTGSYGITGRWRERYEQVDLDRADALVADWGLAEMSTRTVGTLSEGERKRVQIARALMANPELLILDEPAAGLDVAGREDLISRLSELVGSAESPGVVLVTHHVEEIPPGFSHLLLLSRGQLSAAGPISQTLSSRSMSAAFEYALVVEFGDDRWYARGQLPSKGRRVRRNYE